MFAQCGRVRVRSGWSWVVAIAALALAAGCDDGGGEPGSDTMLDVASDTVDDSTQPDTPQPEVDTLEPEVCATPQCNEYEQLDATGCGCALKPGVCSAPNGACDTRLPQPPSYWCGASAGSGTCRVLGCGEEDEPCDPRVIQPSAFDIGSHWVCDALPNDETRGTCRYVMVEVECPSFFDTQACALSETCVPVGPTRSVCMRNGNLGEGSACQAHTHCNSQLLCIAGRCQKPECDPTDADPACDRGTCTPYPSAPDLPIGACIETCAPFTGSDTCGPLQDGRWCLPDDTRMGDAPLGGTCARLPSGFATRGATCDNQTGCASPDVGAAPLICLGGICHQYCDPQDHASCGTPDDGCFPVVLRDAQGNTRDVAWGVCDTNCGPSWTPDDPGRGCDAGEYCTPDLRDAALGRCAPQSAGTVQDGGSCAPNAEQPQCRDGSLCLCTDQNCTNGICERVCNTLAAEGEPGACEPDDNGTQRSCVPLTSGGDALVVGVCR